MSDMLTWNLTLDGTHHGEYSVLMRRRIWNRARSKWRLNEPWNGYRPQRQSGF